LTTTPTCRSPITTTPSQMGAVSSTNTTSAETSGCASTNEVKKVVMCESPDRGRVLRLVRYALSAGREVTLGLRSPGLGSYRKLRQRRGGGPGKEAFHSL